MTNEQASHALNVMLDQSPLMRRVLDAINYHDVSLVVDEHNHMIVISDGWYILPVYREVPSIGGSREMLNWQAQFSVVIPGVRTFPNGDPGYPDEYDYADLDEPKRNIFEALAAVLKNMLQKEMDDAMEAILREDARLL